jgi:hypothetical protein
MDFDADILMHSEDTADALGAIEVRVPAGERLAASS